MADVAVPVESLPAPAPAAGSPAGLLQQAIDLFVTAVTSPAAPALVAAITGHFIIDLLKDWRDRAGKPSFRPAQVRALSVVATQAVFVGIWAAVVHFRHIAWGELDFLYGLAGSLASIMWHHWSPWRDRGDVPTPPTTPG